MGARHSGREAALQMLFQMEASGASADDAIELFWRSFGADADPESRAFAEVAVRGVGATKEALDKLITEASAHWRIERMARVDRNVLRLGVWELAYRPDVPRAVVLDEAVELAKAFGTEESSAFVNGVLNRTADTLGRDGTSAEGGVVKRDGTSAEGGVVKRDGTSAEGGDGTSERSDKEQA